MDQTQLENKLTEAMQIINQLKVRLDSLEYSDRYIFQKHQQILDGRNITTGTSTGTKIGTATTQKLGFFNATPVVQQAAISAPSGGGTVDSQARTAIGTIITTLQTLGLTA